ncbi:hypothetical protein GCM10011579_011000 [Streptomyces albiflavescens]|uniref:Secreted protein n=1 Tax=Streptomyces albiflavescens TaxID=1623582 RepID=A0A917XTH3_9ACTN|nr:hypothetical protein [Streptomyces albiflavescens]GGN53159.1 hypothetical protein GCM10011579_011000 [Streptomyces albiflavescens]
MNKPQHNPHVSRRTVLTRTAVITGAAIAVSLPASQFLASPAYAAGKDPVPGTNPLSAKVREAVRQAEARARRVMTGKPSRNGWEMERAADDGGNIFTRPVPGTPLTGTAGIAVRMGDVETVLVHVVRRFHYEIDELRKGDIVGWRSPGKVRKGLPESNQASGTAVQIRPGSYPAGTRGGFFPQQRLVIEDILTELGGVVRWGGHAPKPDESLFYIAVRPGDPRLTTTASRIRLWDETPGRGAGVLADVTGSHRTS